MAFLSIAGLGVVLSHWIFGLGDNDIKVADGTNTPQHHPLQLLSLSLASLRKTLSSMRLLSLKEAHLNAKGIVSRNVNVALVNSSQMRFFTMGVQLVEKEVGGIQKGAHPGKMQKTVEDRELYLSILSSTSTKREARSYLQRFTPSLAASTVPCSPAILKYLKQSSFTQADIRSRNQNYVQRLHKNHPPPALTKLAPSSTFFIPEISEEEIHVGLVKIRDVSNIDDATLRGIGRTLGQLNQLGLFSVVVVDEALPADASHESVAEWRKLVESQADRIVAVVEKERGQARRVDGCITVAQKTFAPEITIPNLLVAPLSRGLIPVLAPVAFDSTQKIVPTTAGEVVLSITKLLSTHSPDESGTAPVEQPISLDRLIFLDPLGGIPSHDRPSGAHVFINMEQEYTNISAQLTSTSSASSHHLKNLSTLRSALSILAPTTSAIITTPALAAAYANQPALSTQPKSKNPLIHNLLTDKPVMSSSLPVHTQYRGTLTTFLKHGIPLTIHRSGTKLTDPQIDLCKLVALVEDSFGKKLDVEHYLNRMGDHLAALIVAGDYEGAAIVTWEYPGAGRQKVCYLDKFAVLKRSQGTGGVADVVFKSMVEGVHTGLFEGVEGIVWRSRRWNPVNKWYFERARGTYKIPDSGWTMFWTTKDRRVCQERFLDYEVVCRGIEPSLRGE